MRRVISVFLLIIVGSVSSAQTAYTWTGNVSTDWNEPANWNVGTGFPGSNSSTDDTANITSGNPILNVSVEIASLSIGGSASLSINGPYTLTVGGNITGDGTLNVTGVATISAARDFTISTITVNDISGADATFNVGGNFSPGSFTPGVNSGDTDSDTDSTVIFNSSSTDSTAGTYTFHNLTINDPGNTVTAKGDWSVYGVLTMTAGTLDLGNHVHRIWGNWDSSNTNFTLKATTSELVFTGGNDATIETKGIGSQRLNKLQISKNSATVTLASSLELTNHFTLSSGIFSAGATGDAYNIQIGGSWGDSSGGPPAQGFRHRGGKVTFVGGDSEFRTNYPILAPYFHDLEVQESTLNILNPDNRNDVLTINGKLEIHTGAKIDFTNQNFQIGELNNEGEIRLAGSQATQGFPTISGFDNKNRYGLITYYGHDTDSSEISHNEFWNLTIDAPGQTISMTRDITVYGWSDPNGDRTLTNNPGPINQDDLNGLQILNGTLNAESGGVQYDLKLYGMMYTSETGSYNWGTTPISGGATVEFKGPYPAYIGGSNTFFRFLVNTGADTNVAPGEPADATVKGKYFYFQEGKTTTIFDDTNAKFIVVGNDKSPDDGSPDEDWIRLLSGTQGTRWIINKRASVNADMKYVYVQDSRADPDKFIYPSRVWAINCENWEGGDPFIKISSTRDQLNAKDTIAEIDNNFYEPNGRIDRILVEVNIPLEDDPDFSGFKVKVDGYEVLGYDSGNDATDHETLDSQKFWIILKEGNALDTGASPSWRITSNTSLRSASGSGLVSMIPSKDKEIPYDGAPSIVGYTLAVVDSDRKEVFVHFSEPVVDTTAGGEITGANFNTTVGGGVNSIARVSPNPKPSNNGMREVLLTLNNRVMANDVTGNALNLRFNDIRDIPTSKSTHGLDEGDRSDTADTLLSSSHRISDIALGIVGNGIVQPTKATGEQQTSANKFDGSDILWAGDIELEAHRYTGQTFTPVVLYWKNAREIDQSYMNNGLWLPEFDEKANSGNRPFSGLVPRPLENGPSSGNMSSVSGDQFKYDWDSGGEIVNGSDLDFFFRIDGGSTTNHLYAARCEDDTASNWYRRIRPWSIKIRNTIDQAGAVSILNNIINPKNNEKTTLQYQLSSRGTVTIQVFDLSGNMVEVLQRGSQSPGSYTVSWDGRNHAGNVVARGIYFIRFVGPDSIDQIRKVLVVK